AGGGGEGAVRGRALLARVCGERGAESDGKEHCQELRYRGSQAVGGRCVQCGSSGDDGTGGRRRGDPGEGLGGPAGPQGKGRGDDEQQGP
ncbi:MAG: hypothetical protein JSV79_05995, partial [Armatimonadota bacterium]